MEKTIPEAMDLLFYKKSREDKKSHENRRLLVPKPSWPIVLIYFYSLAVMSKGFNPLGLKKYIIGFLRVCQEIFIQGTVSISA